VALKTTDEDVKNRSRAAIIKDLHDQIDQLVFEAYGWSPDLTDEDIVERLVALNALRSREERQGFVRWLRPNYQADRFAPLTHRADRIQSIGNFGRSRSREQFPVQPKEQAAKVLYLLRVADSPLTPDEIASSFKEGKSVSGDVKEILQSLARLGDVNSFDNGRTYFGRLVQ
jgi:hypothetical protein